MSRNLGKIDAMEPEVKRFFNRIILSVAMVLGWLFLTFGIGIYNNLLIPQSSWRWPNTLFLTTVSIVLGLIIRKLIGFWKEKFPHG
jgi:hypothetical protein